MVITMFGSWWSIAGHTLLFLFILKFSNDLLFFNTFVSIEAIYIGILILMAEYKEQTENEKKVLERRTKDRQLVKEDVDITSHVMSEIRLLRKHQEESSRALQEIKISLDTTPRGKSN
jgi:predicted membrane protein